MVPDPVRALAVAFCRLRSPKSKPNTGSVNVAVTVNDPLVGSAAVDANDTPGATVSKTRLSVALATLPLEATSIAMPVAMETSTWPCAVGVITKV